MKRVSRQAISKFSVAMVTTIFAIVAQAEHSFAEPAFSMLWDGYPSGDGAAISKTIGGKVAINNFSNTCVVRLSQALNLAGEIVPGPTEASRYGLNVVSGEGKKFWYGFRVKEFHNYLVAKYGEPDIVVDLSTAISSPPTALIGKKGIIEFADADFSDATGHLDIWNGFTCKEQCYFENVKTVYLWEFD